MTFFLRFWVNVFMHLRGGGAGHRLRVEQDTVMRIFLSQCLHLNTNKRKLGKYKKNIFCWLSFSIHSTVFCDEIERGNGVSFCFCLFVFSSSLFLTHQTWNVISLPLGFEVRYRDHFWLLWIISLRKEILREERLRNALRGVKLIADLHYYLRSFDFNYQN